ncbi:zinc ribbon domain-containing protein [Paenibacillus periandrae]|uniref:zinc ribbon domain-containing protein n=1 Tax=Paenibacillus periandrae TaxID=1761741 RepID=UPI001F091922|nr:zinc ribbon domain-containing protein [Paenibacillus periandrae]
MITCRNCHNKLPSESLFCNICGRKIKITCRNCGNELPDGSLFCNMCGNKKTSIEDVSPVKTIQTTSKSKNIAITIVALLILAIYMVNFFITRENEIQQIKAAQDKQAAEKYPPPPAHIPWLPLVADLPNGYLHTQDRSAYFFRWIVEDNQISGQLEYSSKTYRRSPNRPGDISEITYFKGTIDGKRITFDLKATYNGSKITTHSGQTWKGHFDDVNNLYIDQIGDKNTSLMVFRTRPVEDYHNAINVLLTSDKKL